jgi:hypothetical protein
MPLRPESNRNTALPRNDAMCQERTSAAFAVGTRVTSRPPHRTVRAAFPQTAPTSGPNGSESGCVLCQSAFPLVPALGSTNSAADRSALFVGFTATMAGSDFSCPCIIGCRQWPRNARYQADATPYLGRTCTGWIAPACGWRTYSITSTTSRYWPQPSASFAGRQRHVRSCRLFSLTCAAAESFRLDVGVGNDPRPFPGLLRHERLELLWRNRLGLDAELTQ